MRINTNMAALNAWRALTVNNENMTKSLEKLSSGYRVNRAADDAAGLAVSEKMRAQIRGINMAIRNAQDGISLIQTAEGGASQIQAMVQRMRELAVQASNGTLTDEDREQLQKEFRELQNEVTRTAQTTTFNKLSLLTRGPQGTGTASVTSTGILEANGIKVSVSDPDEVTGLSYRVTFVPGADPGTGKLVITDSLGAPYEITITATPTDPIEIEEIGLTFDLTEFKSPSTYVDYGWFETTAASASGPNHGPIVLQVGPNKGDTIELEIQKLDSEALKIQDGSINIDTVEDASNAILYLDQALETINGVRATLGSYQNRLENAIGTLRIQSENLTAAESRIRDVDMAQEMANFTKYQILQQASTAMLAQANMSTQSILSLLR